MEALSGGAALVVILGVPIFAIILLYYVPMGLWISAVTAGVPLKMSELIGMRRRKVPPILIVQPLIAAHAAEIDVSVRQLEAHHRAGGQVQEVVNTLIRGQMANVELTFSEVAALDLARDDDGGKALAALLASIEERRA
ncbi:MAG: flotillin-like FloA family protein [Bacteroidota bacterium]